MFDGIRGRKGPGSPEISVLAIDISSSMAAADYKPTRLAGAKAAASVFLRRKPLIDMRDLTCVVAFDTAASQVADFGLHPVEAEQALKPLAVRGSTNITGAIELALSLVMKPRMHVTPIRRCILLSDGHHNTGPAPADSGLLTKARQAKMIVDCVAIGDADDASLQTIARETGGQFVRCGNVEALNALYDRLAEKIATR
jgi:Ca-activated chloride channel family protein